MMTHIFTKNHAISTALLFTLSTSLLGCTQTSNERNEASEESGNTVQAASTPTSAGTTVKKVPLHLSPDDSRSIPPNNEQLKKQHADSLKIAVHFSNIYFRYDINNPFYRIVKAQPIMTKEFIRTLGSTIQKEDASLIKRKASVRDAYIISTAQQGNEMVWNVGINISETRKAAGSHSGSDEYITKTNTKWFMVKTKKVNNQWRIDGTKEDKPS